MVTPELWQQVRDVLFEALEVPGPERPSYVAEACAGNRQLRQEVESLLATANEVGDFIQEPAGSLHASEPELAAGDFIDIYKIERRIGRGGMGIVYQAVRADGEFDQRVAIKVVSREGKREEFLTRFRQERQILAGLDHPNVAKLFDGGTTPGGRPYFVMELVEGVRIDRYCDEQKLDLRARVRLFVDVCSAVEYAHRNFVVHRDLKPGNVLVTAGGTPKLLDFGIAKLLDSGTVTEGTTLPNLTDQGTQPMTLAYASPEQICSQAITTASDVYSLGVMLYEILCGHSPYRVRQRTVRNVMRAIEDQDPTKPSSIIGVAEKIGASPAEPIRVDPESIVRSRGGSLRALERRLRGDLDSIALKALRKEPDKRYASVEQLIEDLRRYLEGLPVTARRGTLIYRTTKFVQRHKVKLSLLAAGLAMALTVLLMLRHQQQRERQLVASVKELIELTGEPGVDLEEIAQHLKENVERFGDRPAFAEVLDDQAEVLDQDGEFQIAEVLLRESLAMHRRLGDDDAVMIGLNRLAAALTPQGKFSEAEPLYRETLAIRERRFGRQSEEVARVLNNLTVLYQNAGRYKDAEPLAIEALTIRQKILAPNDPMLASSHHNLAFLYSRQGKYQEAEEHYLKAFEIMREVGDEVRVAQIRRNLAALYVDMGRIEDAEPLARQALETFHRRFVHWRIADAESVLGACLVAQGRHQEAERLLSWSYPAIETAFGEGARQTVEARQRLLQARRVWAEASTQKDG